MDDVFCMVKERMASDKLSQPPLLVFPGALAQDSKDFLKKANDRTCPIQICQLEKERLSELRILKTAIGKDFPFLNRAMAFYDSMIGESPCSGTVPKLSFLNRANTDGRRDWGAAGIGQRPRLPKPYELQVVFHRARV